MNFLLRGLTVVALALIVLPRFAAEAAGEVRRIGVLGDTPGPHWETFRETLAELRYMESKTVAIEWRWAEGQLGRFPGFAAELVRAGVDVIVTEGTPATRAAKAATRTIPIVMAIAGDPVGTGFVQSLTHPGGNITGSSSRAPEQYPKQMELLKEALPRLSRLTVLWNPGSPVSRLGLKEIESAAHVLRIQLELVEARESSELQTAFSMLSGNRTDAVLVVAEPTFDSLQEQIAALATKARLPAVYNKTAFADAGGLLAYGARYSDFFRRAAHYVDKILKGAKPAALPVEQPTRFELVVNMRTAKALGLTMPPSLLLRADRVIE